MPQRQRLQFHLSLESGRGHEAARDALALMSEQEWALVVEFALSVVSLQEAVAAQTEYLVVARERE